MSAEATGTRRYGRPPHWRRGSLALLAAFLVGFLPVGEAGAQGEGEGAGTSSPHTLVQTGHHGRVLAMEYDAKRSLAFTAGEDGILKIWNTASNALVGELAVGPLRPTAIALNPVSPLVAVIESDGARQLAASAWDWERGTRLFRVPLEAEPLFARWSGGGSWLMLGEPKWQGLRLIDTRGQDVPFHPEGFGIVGFAEVSRGERTIMTYLTGGRIIYWDLATGGPVQEVRTSPYLSLMRVSEDRRLAAGTNGQEVLLIDLVTGSVRSRVALAGVRSLDLSPSGDEVACVATGPSGATLSRWRLTADPPMRLEVPAPPAPLDLVLRAGGVLYASGGGAILELQGVQWTVIARDEMAEATGLVAAGGVLAMASPDWIWLFRLEASETQKTGGIRAPVILRNPLQGPTGLSALGGLLIAWRAAEGSPGAVTIDPSQGSVERQLPGLQAPLAQVEALDGALAGRILTLDRSGTVRIVDATDGRSSYEDWLPATLRVAALGGSQLVAGRTPIGSGGSLVRIDTATGERVSIPTRGRILYDLLYDEARGALYAIGVMEGSSALLGYSGARLENETLIELVPGEDLGASLVLDRTSDTLYSSLGSGAIRSWGPGDREGTVPTGGRTARRLAAGGGLLASLNKDGTVSVWELGRETRLPAVLTLFAQGGWCLVEPDGRYSGSEDGVSRVRVVRQGSPVADPAPWRLPLN